MSQVSPDLKQIWDAKGFQEILVAYIWYFQRFCESLSNRLKKKVFDSKDERGWGRGHNKGSKLFKTHSIELTVKVCDLKLPPSSSKSTNWEQQSTV